MSNDTRATTPSPRPYYPEHVHPTLVKRLFAETDRLSCSIRWRSAPLPFDMADEAVRLTLCELAGKRAPYRRLDPTSRATLDELVECGSRLVRFWWWKLGRQALCHYMRSPRRNTVSIDTEGAESWLPAHEDAYFADGRYEALLATPIAKGMMALFKRERIGRARATLLTLVYLSGDDQDTILCALTRDGNVPASAPTLRRWISRQKVKFSSALRALCVETQGVPSSSEAHRQKPPHAGRRPGTPPDKTVHIDHGNARGTSNEVPFDVWRLHRTAFHLTGAPTAGGKYLAICAG